jgi:hypothetical protein
MQKAMEITGKRAIIAAINWEILKGEPLTNATINLTTLMTNGTINGTENLIMTNNTLSEWIEKISDIKTNFDTNINFSDFS